jgi:uncharacterized membrane protein YhaH (DUF805 family)
MPVAGWYDDPRDASWQRWWDGRRWTDQRRARMETPPPPPPPPLGRPNVQWSTSGSIPGWDPSAFRVPVDPVDVWPAPPRTFWDAVKVCLVKYAVFEGRASRSEYWYFVLFSFIVGLATGGFGQILLLLPEIAAYVRRLQDLGRSAWNLLWLLLPIVGWIVLFVFAVQPGEPKQNAYG